MTLHVHQLSPSNPVDHLYLPAIARVHLAAWLTVPLMRAIYYGPPDAYPGYLASILERHSRAFREEKNCRFAVVLDDALPADEEVVERTTEDDGDAQGQGTPTTTPKGKVIAAIKYYFIDTDLFPPSSATTSTAEPKPTSSSSNAERSWPPYSHAALASDTWSHLVRSRTRLSCALGSHVLVDNLYTDPNHHRRGAGGMLMRLACEEADRRGWPSMLEASPKGIGVYQSVGFRRFNANEERDEQGGAEIWADLQRWENGGDRGVEFSEQRLKQDGGRRGEGWYCQVVMVRPAGTGGIGASDGKEVAGMSKGEAAVV
ncbi:uncharacterized protein Z519_03695 [Cladophialophora bantiana CBS 173.52]|uniref:N-acetyltransferase domain-containing protein n=1 Tax=Cladophialophora bantiana (strain ATCC 10958 / CBS 173.52 / CDC B-1940 / NIH 8579) TaxID=1442370 RepID=A0A0D2EYR7_CLAB1|nr:uncharacterized protein Z519_03695 [Cladophialophora bantiana CBS 173.52]KIW95111.1 hypothetical protein Z519_03695 [Cladophialophora bantiana CBS 173.52]